MKKYKYIILGAGPAGLTFANVLKQNNILDFFVIEKESTAGGLCRSEYVDGADLDIGGGHFLDVRRPAVDKFLFGFMPESEWRLFKRDSRISLKDKEINHPFEANIWQMDIDSQIEYLKSIAAAGCNTGKEMPEGFIEWINWKLGDKIAEEYMLPYNQKMFSDELRELGTYWLNKLPNVSFEDTLRSCLEGKPYGTQLGHAEFYYPKNGGYGMLWLKMADSIKDNIVYNCAVETIDLEKKVITTSDGSEYTADCIITTVPWKSFRSIKNADDRFMESVGVLKHSSIEIRYFNETMDTKAHWIYYPDLKKPYHRILFRHNFLEGSNGYWTETRIERIPLFESEPIFSYVNEYAYPLNTLKKPAAVSYILEYAKEKNVFGLGRWGEHEHYNSDLVVERAMELAQKLIKSVS